MAFSRSAKIWLIVVSIPLLLLLGGIVALKVFFTGERLKEFLLPRIEEASGRSVAVGDISLSFFPALAVEVDSLKISNKPGDGFSSNPVLEMEQLVLNVQIIPLFSGRVEIPTIRLERPVLFLEILADGESNYAGEEEPGGAETPDSSAGLTGGEFLLTDVEISRGRVEYYDREGNSAIIVDGLNISTRIDIEPAAREARFNVESSVDGLTYGSLTTPLISGLRLTSKQTLLYKEELDEIVLEEGEASVADIILSMRGEVKNVSTMPEVNVVVESPSASIPELLSLAPKEYMKKAEGLEGTGTARIKIIVKGPVGDAGTPEITGLVSATNATIRYASLPRPITNVNIIADFTRTEWKQELRVTDFSAELGKNPLSARMTVEDFENPYIDLDVDASLDLAEVKDYYPLESGTEMSGRMKADVSISGRVSTPQRMKASGSLDFRGVNIQNASTSTPIRNMNGEIRFNNEIVESKKLVMQIGKSDLSLAFWLKNYLSLVAENPSGAKPNANVTLTSKKLYTADLTGESSAAKGGQKTEGRQKDESSLPFSGVDMDVSATIGMLQMEKFELRNVRTNMHISEGIVTLRNFSGNTFNGTIISKGSIDMRDPAMQPFDMTLTMNGLDAHQMLPNFTSFGNRMHGNLSMNTVVKGALDDTLGLIPDALNGSGRVQVRSGRVEGVRVNELVSSMLSLPDLRVINFKDWDNSFTLAKGRMQVKDLKISALKADYLVNGSVGLDGSLDYLMTLLLPPEAAAGITVPGVPGFVGQAVDLFKDPSGKIRLDFTVRGTTNRPEVSLNTDAAAKKAEDLAKRKLEEEKKKLEDELLKKAGDLLKDFDPFKKKDGP